MPAKLVVIVTIVLLIVTFVACYTRIINIDNIITRNDPPLHFVNILVYNLDNRFAASRVGEGFIINNNRLRFFSSCIPPVKIRVSELKNGKDFFVTDNAGNQFLLGNIKSTEVRDGASFCTINSGAKDKVLFKSAFSLMPYYYGVSIFLSGPVSRYYHYYSFKIEKESGASLLLEWKFSTYKGEDGKFVADLFGDNKEGLVNLVIK